MKSEDLNVTWQQPVDPNLWQRPGLRLKLIEFLVKSFDSQGRIYGEPVAFGKNHRPLRDSQERKGTQVRNQLWRAEFY